MSGVVYGLVVMVLVCAVFGFLVVASTQGWTLFGVLALFGALAALAALISYASTMRGRRRPPMP